MTPDVLAEWKRHRSGFARRWQVSMTARKKLQIVETAPNDVLRGKIEQATASARDLEAMVKDFHLIEASIEMDRIIISLDEDARQLFGRVSTRVGELRKVMWVNPELVDEEPIAWLEHGARTEKQRLLGFKEEEDP